MTAPKFTVFTPTHNRAHTLERIYNSLKSQAVRDFEWVIIYDRLVDNTADIIREWRRGSGFSDYLSISD